jgi:integrase
MLSSPQIARFSDGERFPYLQDRDGLMSLWPSLFTLVKSRPNKTANTIRNQLAAISHFHTWQWLEKRDLLREFEEQRFPTEVDIESLKDHCYRDSIDLKRFMRRAEYLPRNSIELTAPIKNVSLQTVEKSHAYNRITVVGEYLYFCAVTMLRGRPNAGELNKRATEMRKCLLATRPKGKLQKSGLAVHPSLQHFDEFMSVVVEDSQDNPFKSREVRLRNYVMFECLYETGMRSGELLSLYVGDILYDDKGDPIVRILDRRDDPNDPRPNPPQVKTLERDIPISQKLYDKIQEYILVRYSTPNARKYPFLIVNHRHDKSQGFPMSDKNFQLELKRVVAVRPDRFKDIRRHGFRHNFNVNLTNQLDLYSIEEKSLTDQQRLDIRKDLNGHEGDDSGEIYEKNATRAKAKKAVRQFQGKQSSILKKALAQAKGSESDDSN